MRTHKTKSAINLLFLASLLVASLLVASLLVILLAACGDVTATTGPAAQPTAIATTAPATTVATTTGTAITAPASMAAKPTTGAVTTAPATTKPVTTTVPATTNPVKTTAATTAPVTTLGATTQPYPSPNMDATSVPIMQGQSFQLKMNQTAFLPADDLYITFLSISEDSRCPEANHGTGKSVACFASGQVTADIKVTMNNGQASQTVKLTLPGSVNTNTASKVTMGNFQLEIKEILPRAVIDDDIAPGDYIVTLVVTKV